MVRFLAVFITILYVTLNSVALGFLPAYGQPTLDQISSPGRGGCENTSATARVISPCDIGKHSGFEKELSKHCLFHIYLREPAVVNCMALADHKRASFLTRRLVSLQSFGIKKPPRLIS